MRVALSLLTLVPGISGGSETYARALAAALARRGAVDAVALVPTLAPDAGAGLPSRVVDAYPASTSIPGRLLAMARAGLAPGRMRAAFADADVVHYPLTVPVPRPRGPRVAITLHDLQHRDLPGLFPRGELLFRRLAYDRAAGGADAVIVPSAFVRERAVALLGLPEERLHVVPLGVDLERFTPADGERQPFLLYPARPWPHKDHDTLLAAFRLLRARHAGLELVLTGAGTERFAGIEGVRALGTVGLDRLVELYRTAACCVVPSRYEGFGLPPLEAMACGAPVAAARAGSLPEVCGDAAVLFEPGDPEAIATAVEDAFGRAPELSAGGRAHAARFTWDATAEAHERVYRALA